MGANIAEVIESSTRHFVGEVFRDSPMPVFGSWVCVDRSDGIRLYGLVSHIETGSLEPHRRATAYGLSREELQKEMPQVLELVRTVLRAQVLAYRTGDGTLRQTLPPRPADLHAPIQAGTQAEVRAIGYPYDYLRTLVSNPDPAVPVDDLIVAVLGQVFAAFDGGKDGKRALLEAGRCLGRLLNEDHERLQSIIRRVC